MDTLQLITDARIIPTLKVTRAADAPPLLAALCSGGITAALITLRSDDAYDILRQGNRLFPDLLLGAEGLSSPIEVERAVRSGARIIATNGFSGEIADCCKQCDVFYLPYCLSPSEMLAHQMQGGVAAGIFSPEAFGQTAAVEAFGSAFPRLSLIPAHIPLDKLSAYLSMNAVVACTCPDIAQGTLDEVIDKCRRACAIV